MPDSLVVMPDSVTVLRAYLLSVPEVTTRVGTRIATKVASPPVWPAIRITDLTVVERVPRRIDRVLVQLDCFAATEPEAHLLARGVTAALRASRNYLHATAVLGGADDLSASPMPDETFTPPQPRWVVTAHIYLHPVP